MNEENVVDASQASGIPETQIDDFSSNAVEELVNEMERKDEETQEVKKEEKVETNKFASKFAALSRREKQLKAKEAELSKKLAELEKAQVSKEEKAKIPEPKKLEDFDKNFQREFRRDPFGALERMGHHRGLDEAEGNLLNMKMMGQAGYMNAGGHHIPQEWFRSVQDIIGGKWDINNLIRGYQDGTLDPKTQGYIDEIADPRFRDAIQTGNIKKGFFENT